MNFECYQDLSYFHTVICCDSKHFVFVSIVFINLYKKIVLFLLQLYIYTENHLPLINHLVLLKYFTVVFQF